MTDLTPERLHELRRIAEAATPGPWEVVGLDGYGGPYALRMPHRSGRTWYGVEGIKRREDAEYFVAMNRNTVLALLDEIERLRREQEEIADNVTRFVLYDPELNAWECQADDCRFWWEFEVGDPYDHDMRFCPRCGRRIVRGRNKSTVITLKQRERHSAR